MNSTTRTSQRPRVVWGRFLLCLLLVSGGAVRARAGEDSLQVNEAPEAGQESEAPDLTSSQTPELLPADPAPEEHPDIADPTADARTWRDAVDGRLELRLDAARSRRHSDLDLHQTLRLRVRPPESPNWSFVGTLWLHENVGGRPPITSALRDIYDASGSDVRLRVLDLYAQYDHGWNRATLRIGRQRITDSPWYNRIDGVYFKQYQQQWDWYVYGGARASLYESPFDDLILGGGVSYRPTHQTRIAVDVIYADEDRRVPRTRRFYNPVAALLRPGYPRRIQPDVSDAQVALSVWHDITPNIRVFGRYKHHDSGPDELLLDLVGYHEPWDLTYELMYRRQLDRVTDRVNDLTAYYRILGPQNEYNHFLLNLHKPLNRIYILSLEAELHDASNDARFTANRDYYRLAAILTARDLWPGVKASIGLERWDVSHGEGVWALTGEVRKAWADFEVYLGADYERYKDELVAYQAWPNDLNQLYILLNPAAFRGFLPLVRLFDTATIRTRENIYTVYTGFNWEVRPRHTLRTKLIFENDDRPDSPYWRIQAAYEIRF